MADPSRSPKRLRKALRVAAKTVVAAVGIWLLARLAGRVGWDAVLDVLGRAHPAAIVVAAAALTGRFAFWNARWRVGLREVAAAPPFGSTFFTLMGAMLINHVTPTVRIFGGLFRARHVARAAGAPFGRVYGSVLFDLVLQGVVMFAMGWIALLVLGVRTGRPGIAAGCAAAGVAVAGGVALLWHRWGRRESGFVTRAVERSAAAAEALGAGLRSQATEAVATCVALLDRPPVLSRALAAGAGVFLSGVAAQWVVFEGLGGGAGPLVVFAAVALGMTVGTVTGSPGGIGVTEAGMIVAYTALGTGRAEAVAATLLFRGLHYAVVAGLGVPSVLVREGFVGRPPSRG